MEKDVRKKIAKLKRRKKNFTVFSTPSGLSVKKHKKEKIWVPPYLGELKISFKKSYAYKNKKMNTITLWECKVDQEYLEMFLRNVFISMLPGFDYKKIVETLAKHDNIVLPVEVKRFNYYIGGVKKRKLKSDTVMSQVKKIIIEII